MRLQRSTWAFSLCLLLAVPVKMQTQITRPPVPNGKMETIPNDGGDDTQQRMARDMAKKANLERHAVLKSDTDKLFKLAEELKNSVDKSNENILSLDVLKKADEIEKLARSVKEKMKGPN